jgi:SAM-dependent methyltransferase
MPLTLPRILNIGSGKNFREDCLNIDIHDGWQPDLVADLNLPLPLPDNPLYQTRRFGPIHMPTDYFDQILAFDVLEHLAQLTTAMTTCLNLLRKGGTLHVVVPYDLSHGAWQDPTHVRAFNENSWLYYTDWFWYLGWREHRFVMRQLNYNLSPLGMRLHQEGMPDETVLRTPRAIDAMQVVMEKVPLSAADLQELARFRPPSE